VERTWRRANHFVVAAPALDAKSACCRLAGEAVVECEHGALNGFGGQEDAAVRQLERGVDPKGRESLGRVQR
jgi:hypothetical protein